jgi:hypothetical protein
MGSSEVWSSPRGGEGGGGGFDSGADGGSLVVGGRHEVESGASVTEPPRGGVRRLGSA